MVCHCSTALDGDDSWLVEFTLMNFQTSCLSTEWQHAQGLVGTIFSIRVAVIPEPNNPERLQQGQAGITFDNIVVELGNLTIYISE